MESIEQTFSGLADFGQHLTCGIWLGADLLYRTTLQVKLPEINSSDAKYARWLDFPGEQLIDNVEVQIGGQRIDKHYGDWMHIWNQLTLSPGQKEKYHKMIGHTTDLTYVTDPSGFDTSPGLHTEGSFVVRPGLPKKSLPATTLYIPLQFWFCRNPGLAIPLKKIKENGLELKFKLRDLSECLWAVNSLDPSSRSTRAAAYDLSLVGASLYCEMIFLDEKESKRFALTDHEYLIEQVQFSGDESIGGPSNKIDLNFNHPCKELIWVVRPDLHNNYADPIDGSGELANMLGAQPFNYTDHIDLLSRSAMAYFRPNFVSDLSAQSSELLRTSFGNGATIDCSTSQASPGWSNAGPAYSNNTAASTSDSISYINMQTSRKQNCWGENPVVFANLEVNGQARFSEREGSYFNLDQPYHYHSGIPDTGINVYSFALYPEETQPSGTCNFSQIEAANLQLIISPAAVGGTQTAKVKVYAINYTKLNFSDMWVAPPPSLGYSTCVCLP